MQFPKFISIQGVASDAASAPTNVEEEEENIMPWDSVFLPSQGKDRVSSLYGEVRCDYGRQDKREWS